MQRVLPYAILALILMLTSIGVYAQVPQLINYQAVARSASGQALANQNIAVRLSVRQSTAAGTVQYQERHTVTTNAQGLFNVQIGAGTVLSGTFAGITWADAQQKHLQIELDPAGGTTYTNMGTQQLVSVPYALVAGSVVGGGSSAAWNISGNAGTNPATNFIGTTDNQPLQFRVNNQPAGRLSTTNAAMGVNALANNTSGASNTALGISALTNNTTGNENTAAGSFALTSNSTGTGNAAFGSNALLNNNTGNDNTATGSSALRSNTGGAGNTGIGNVALYSNTTGNENTALGTYSLYNNTTGNGSTALGAYALQSNTVGQNNTALGNSALFGNTSGYNNTATGVGALSGNSIGSNNTANGSDALLSNTSGFGNTAIGKNVLKNNTSGELNTAVGTYVLGSNTSGSYNAAIGAWGTMGQNTIGSNNAALGYNALFNNVEGNNNTANGLHALFSNVSGSWNTCIGDRSDVSVNNLNGASSFGTQAITNADNKIVLGYTTGMTIGGYTHWSNLSDGRFKQNVKSDVPGLSFIEQLRPVTYTVDISKLQRHITAQMPDTIAAQYMPTAEQITAANAEIRTGFIAQEVEATAKKIGYNFDGINPPKNPTDNYSLEYAGFVPSLVKAVQEQQAMIEVQQKTITDLLKRIEQLEAKLP